jgi:hypothetical protein
MITNFGNLLTVIVWLFHAPFFQMTQGSSISYPEAGSSIQGIVEIQGTITLENLDRAEISYSYSDSSNPNWFIIYQGLEPVQKGIITRWDTTTITDGTYKIRLSLYLKDGTVVEQIIDPVYVRNYTFEISGTPTALLPGTPTPLHIETEKTQTILPTLIPANPGAIAREEVNRSMVTGVILAGLCMAILGVYSFIGNRK